MKSLLPEQELLQKLLFILQRSFVEIRLLSQAGKSKQAFDLADAVENIPRYILRWNHKYLKSLEFDLQTYQNKYLNQGSFDYISYINDDFLIDEF